MLPLIVVVLPPSAAQAAPGSASLATVCIYVPHKLGSAPIRQPPPASGPAASRHHETGTRRGRRRPLARQSTGPAPRNQHSTTRGGLTFRQLLRRQRCHAFSVRSPTPPCPRQHRAHTDVPCCPLFLLDAFGSPSPALNALIGFSAWWFVSMLQVETPRVGQQSFAADHPAGAFAPTEAAAQPQAAPLEPAIEAAPGTLSKEPLDTAAADPSGTVQPAAAEAQPPADAGGAPAGLDTAPETQQVMLVSAAPASPPIVAAGPALPSMIVSGRPVAGCPVLAVRHHVSSRQPSPPTLW